MRRRRGSARSSRNPLLRHPKGDDDVHKVPVAVLPGIPRCGRDPVPASGVVANEVGDPEHTPVGGLHQKESRLEIRPLPLAQFLEPDWRRRDGTFPPQ